MTETQTAKAPKCQREHGNMWFGMFWGCALTFVALGSINHFLPEPAGPPGCADFRRQGYSIVPPTNRATAYVDEFRQKTAYKPEVRLYASQFGEAYGWSDPCDGREIIVIWLQYLNTWSDDELRGLMAHEFGHKLANRHPKPTDGSSDQGQHEADGYGIELVGEPAFTAFLRRNGWDERGAREHIKEGKKALVALRKRTPLI